MALQFAANTVPANLVTALNLQHAALWSAGPVHYDLAEVDPLGVEQVPVTFYASAITTLSGACNAANKIKAIYNDHLGRASIQIYAHKTADVANPVSTADMADGSTYDAALLATLITLTNDLRAKYEAHRLDGSTAHHAVDAVAILGGQPTISSWAELATELNNLKAQYSVHITRATTSSVHDNADATNTISAANASSTDPDSCLLLANALRTAYEAHRTQASVHFASDTTNTISASAASYPANLFTLTNALKGAYNTHRTSTTYHATGDSTNVVTGTDATTVTTLIALVEELRTDLTAHLRAGPASYAVRSL